MEKRVIVLFFILQILILTTIALGVFLKSQSNVSVNYINRKNVISSPSGDFKFFFEPKANTNQADENKKFEVYYTINGDTLNDRYDYEQIKGKRIYRIITLGDSFTFGLHVDTKNNWTEILEDLLNNKKCEDFDKFEVINLGVSGYDRQYALQRFIKRGVKYSPNLVIWFDFEPYRNTEKIQQVFNDYLKTHPPGELPSNFKSSIQYELIAKTSDEELQKMVIATSQKFSKYYSGKLILMALPAMSRSQKDTLKKVASLRSSTYFFDGLPDIYKYNLTFLNDGHPNKEGSRQIAQTILRYLFEKKIVGC